VANIQLKDLQKAIEAQGLFLDEEDQGKLLRAWRLLENPNGCPTCGQHVLVGVPTKRRGKEILLSACCKTVLG
jgi:hypothetical protein